MKNSKRLGRPQKYGPGTRTNINIHLGVETAEAIRAKAREAGRTIGDVLTELVSRYLREIKPPAGADDVPAEWRDE